MVRRTLFALLLVAVSMQVSVQAGTVTAADFQTLTYTNADGTMPYRMYVPGGYVASTKYPLVLFLHGVGENGTNNTSQLNNRANGAFVFAEQTANPSFMIAPQNWNNAGGWGSDVLRRQILAIIQKAQNDYNIDKDRIYVVGLSNGGAGTWDQLNTHPWLYAAAVPICGWGSASEKMKDIPIWAFHAADDGTVGVAGTDNAVNGVRNLGGNAIYTRYATGGHGSWGPAFSTPQMVDWLFSQRRGVRDWTILPNLKITTPTGNKNFETTATTLNIGGTATDMLPADGANTGITALAWTNDRGGNGAATGTTSWSVSGITLQAGLNKIRVIATGTSYKSGNGGNTTFTDNIVVRSGAADTTAPVVTISAPSTTPFSTTSQLFTMQASASDTGGVVDFLWSSDRGYNGTAQSSWPILLVSGNNVITVTAIDAAGNVGTKTVTIVYTPVSGNQPPLVSAGPDRTTVLPTLSASLDGTVSDDGLAPGNATTTVTWSKVSGPGTVTFGNASAVDTTATFTSAGVHTLRLTASDGALNASADVKVVIGYQRLLFDFGAAATTTTGNWNNVTELTTGQKVTGARDSVGTTTSVNLSLNTGFTGANSNGTGSAMYPTTAQQDSFYVQNAVVGTVALSGLNASAQYHFTFFASRTTEDDRTTEYTIGATKVTLNPVDNNSKVAHISGITPAGGNTTLTVTADNATGYGYLGVLDVIRISDPGSGSDTTIPAVAITTPTSNATHTVTATPLNIGGTASDNVAVTQVSWANNRGGSGTATGTTTWSVSGIVLQSGANIITVTARDAANNTSTDTITVTYNPPDTTKPVVTISTPTANATHTVSATPLSIGGTASDNVAVTQVSWANNRGGSGTATGTTTWNASGIVLQTGANVITVTARDAANNTATDTLTVTYNVTQPPSNNPPVIASAPIANPNPVVAGVAVSFAVSASDADSDALTYVWDFNDGSGETTELPTHTFAAAGSYVVSVTVVDGKGGDATSSVTVVVSAPDDGGGNGGGGGGGGGTGPIDTDGDGVSDTDEIAAGTNPNDPNSGPMKALVVTAAQGSVKMGVEGKDALRISGLINELPANFSTDGVVVLLNAGGATSAFTLNAKGSAKTDAGTFALKLKLTRNKATKTKSFTGGSAPFKAKIAKGTWSDDWADEGLNADATVKDVPMALNVRLTLGGQLYGVTLSTTYKASAGKGAAFKKTK